MPRARSRPRTSMAAQALTVRPLTIRLVERLDGSSMATSDGVRYALKTFANHQFLSTDTQAVERELTGLVEKFIVSGHRGRADALTVLSRRYLDASPNETSYDVLRMLCCLANSPTTDPTWHAVTLSPGSGPTASADEGDIRSALKALDLDDGWHVEFDVCCASSSEEDQDGEGVDTTSGETMNRLRGRLRTKQGFKDAQVSGLDAKSLPSTSSSPFADFVLKVLGERRAGGGGGGAAAARKTYPTEQYRTGEAPEWTVPSIIRRVVHMLNGVESDMFPLSSAKFSVRRVISVGGVSSDAFEQFMDRFCCMANASLTMATFVARCVNSHTEPSLQAIASAVSDIHMENSALLKSLLKSPSRPKTFHDLHLLVEPILITAMPLSKILHPFIGPLNDGEEAFRCASLLTALYDGLCTAIASGNPRLSELLFQLLLCGCKPYVQTLQHVIELGSIPLRREPQFMVALLSNVVRDTSNRSRWMQYSMRSPECIPVFLRPLSEHLIESCRSISLLQQCKQSVQAFANLSKTGDIYGKFLSRMQSAANSLYAVPFETVMKEAILVPCLERFRSVDAFVVRHFISSCNLGHQFNQLRSCFFMTHGHRFVDFIGEYARQMSSTGAVDGDELTRVLRYAHADDGVDVDDMTVSGNEANVPEIHVNVEFPLSVAITDEHLKHYNAIFGLLVEIRCAKQTLEALMKDTAGAFRRFSTAPFSRRRLLKRFMHLKFEIVHFVNNLNAYMVSGILNHASQDFMSQVQAAGSICRIERLHSASLQGLMRDLLLHERTRVVLDHVRSILVLAGRVREWMHGFANVSAHGDVDECSARLDDIEHDFRLAHRFLLTLLNQVVLHAGSNSSLGSVLSGLNFNSFYKVENLAADRRRP
ncbi:unnamed protein product (mitochondrion) [Plasmodiophora brassicae]|uniref:Spindle pole body component n=1 Tax=Plasmodiophora brassicae TaxID=37360 RepID=A0A3P3YMV0_PLABS|nr:unnamed protein product [Plasmodiophora brassicae]